MPNERTAPAKGQTWKAKTPGGEQTTIKLVDVGPRRVAFHGTDKNLVSITHATLHERFVFCPADFTRILRTETRLSRDGALYSFHPEHA